MLSATSEEGQGRGFFNGVGGGFERGGETGGASAAKIRGGAGVLGLRVVLKPNENEEGRRYGLQWLGMGGFV